MMALYIIDFLLFCCLVLYPCGSLILGLLKVKINSAENLIISLNLGIVVSVIVFYLFNYLKVGWLVEPLLFIPLIYIILKGIKIYKQKVNWFLVSLIVLITIIQSLISVTSGDVKNDQIRLINIHQFDSTWIIALTNSVQDSIPPTNPGYAGVKVQNYHYFLSAFVAVSQNITKIPTVILYFKFIDILLLFLFTATSYIFIKKLTGSSRAGYAGILLLCLSSNLYYLVKVFYPAANITPSIFWINEYETRMVNYQLLVSYNILISWFFLLTQKSRSILILSILAGCLISFKSYVSVLLLPSLFIVGIISAFKREYFYVKLAVLTTIATLVFYVLANPIYKPAFILQPFYLIETMFAANDHLNYSTWILRVQTYASQGNMKRIIQLYSEGILLFIFGNFGLRIIGFYPTFKKNTIIYIMYTMMIVGILSSLLLVAKGVAWNSVQFSYYSIIISSILTVCTLYNLSIKHKPLAIVIFLITWISLLPGVFYTTNYYLSKFNSSFIDKGLYQTTLFLAKEPKGIVLVNPKYFNNSIISAFSHQQSYLANIGMLDTEQLDYSNSEKELFTFFENKNIDQQFLIENKISYIVTDNQDNRNYEKYNIPLIYTSGDFKVFAIYK